MTLIRVMLDYVHPWPNAAGFYVARDRGWYRDAGLEVELTTHDYGRGDTLAHLGRYEVDFGVFPSNRLLVRRENREPLIGIAAISQTGLETIQAVRRAGITRPRDLEGRRIGFGLTPRGKAMVSHLVAADGGDPSKVIAVSTSGHELTPDYLVASGLDALFGGYWCWDVLSRGVPEEELITWRVSDIGAPSYHSYLLGTQEWTAQSNPELVRSRSGVQRARWRGGWSHVAAGTVLDWSRPAGSTTGAGASSASTTWSPGYAKWLADNDVLASADVWRGATTNEFVPDAGERA